jgi:hypothetical protein
MKQNSGSLCFTVTGEFITKISRTWWADEDRPEKALNILREAFPDMKEADRLCIVTGSKKLTGDSTVGCNLIDDDATVSECGNTLTLDRMIARFRLREDENADYMQLATGDTAKLASPHGLVEVPSRRTELRTNAWGRREPVLKDGVDLESIPYREIGVSSPATPATPATPTAPAEPRPISRLKPKSLSSIPKDAEDGWLSPGGKFFTCGVMEHILLADDLGATQGELEKRGWLSLSAGKIHAPYRSLDGAAATQAQLNRIFDWCLARKEDMPYWAKEKENE